MPEPALSLLFVRPLNQIDTHLRSPAQCERLRRYLLALAKSVHPTIEAAS